MIKSENCLAFARTLALSFVGFFAIQGLSPGFANGADQATELGSEEPIWGEPIEGLQAGLLCRINRGLFSAVMNKAKSPVDQKLTCFFGEEVSAEMVVRNISDRPISFTKSGGIFPTAAFTGESGETTEVRAFGEPKTPFADRRTLGPGEQTYFSATPFHFARADYDSRNRKDARVESKEGESFSVNYSLKIEQHDDEWSGTLSTGSMTASTPDPVVTRTVKIVSTPEPAPASPEGKRTVLWGDAINGLRAGILIAGTHDIQRRSDISVGNSVSETILIRNESDEEISIRWKERISQRGSWQIIDEKGNRTHAHNKWRRSWELQNPDSVVTIPRVVKSLFTIGHS